MIQTAIFDRDGVLTYFDVDAAGAFYGAILPLTVEEIGKRWQMWGMQVGFPTSEQAEESFFSSFWTALGQEYTLDPTDIAQLIDRPYTDFVVAYPDAAPLLAALKSRGFQIGVLSNFSLFSLDASLRAAGLAPYVDVAHAATIRGNAKPHPDAYRQIAQALHVAPEACLYIDDEEPCVVGAAQIGMTAVQLDRDNTHAAPHRHSLGHSLGHSLADLRDIEAVLAFCRN